ncbi:hypothetical protein OHA72_50615 [Dactylosporangium sp. NBC_01737]|uniref:hypothetical protein n=1 Tax=Dactylosporangium sp. NBC_01737 TaxID=2975959 RepID=UPI002E115700|nr:hypothetical protein OHA72_50615 [Dactylosporangium sp. NBC_01737]
MLTRLTAPADTWELIWTWVGRVLVVNLGLAVTNLPLLLALSIVDRPWRYPLFFGVLCLGLGPSVAAAFAHLHGDSFVRAYRRHFGRAALRWSVVVGGVGVVAVDVVALHDADPGALLVPMLVVLAVLLLAAGTLWLAMLPLEHGGGVREALWTALRRWPLSLLSLTVLVAAAAAVNQAPVLGLATVPGCALFVVWHNSRAAVTA